MKLRLPSRSLSFQPQPLEKAVAALVLALCVGAHFFALGSKADPALLAYDESQSWRVPVSFFAPSASEVLFTANHSWQAPATRSLGMTDKPVLSPSWGVTLGAPLQAASTRFEASLAALNFRY